MENPFEESNKQIEQFLLELELEPMHLSMYLEQKCSMICRTVEEDNEFNFNDKIED
jgi:hypothetical protein